MNVLLLSQVFPPRTGGSGRWLYELYRRLSRVDVHVVAGAVRGADSFDRMSGLPTTRFPLDFAGWGVVHPRSSVQYVRRAVELRRLAAESRADVIHCGKCLPEGLLALMVKFISRLPYSCYVHGEELALARTTRELAFLTGVVLRGAETIIANSDHSREMLTHGWGVPARKVAVLHPGVNTDQFVPGVADAGVRTRLGWSEREVVLTVGALQQRKGQDMMIRALPAIRARCPNVLYAVVGQGWERAHLEELAKAHGVAEAVQFRGAPDDAELIECYQQCDLFALPNRQVGWDFEGFGMALIEAQACGRPVLAGLSGGAPETVAAGRSGVLVSCAEPEALAAATVSLLNDPDRRAAMGRFAREWAVQRFDWRVLVPQAQALFGVA